MSENNHQRSARPYLWLIKFVGVIVPRRLRADWQQEWEAEFCQREALLAGWDNLNWKTKLDLLRRSLGAFRDALLLQPRRLEDEMIQDLRFGIRMLLKNKSFTVVAVLSLALGIGANTAIFQLLNAVLLRTLPVKAPQELANIQIADMNGARGSFSSPHPGVTNPIWEQIRDRQQAFSGVFAWGADSLNLAPGGETHPAQALWVSGDFFNVLSVRPALGRVFTAADDQHGCGAPGVVMSYRFWEREYGGDPNIIGRRITLDNRPLEIIGVASASFFGLEVGQSFDVALPICAEAIIRGDANRLASGTDWWLMVMGRLEPGWSPERATAQLQAISPSLFEATLPANYPPVNVKNYLEFKLSASTAGTGLSSLRSEYERSLWLLLAIAGLVLLVACANLANLLLARASVREREIAVRQALGARRWRLIRQLLVESLLLAIAGAVLGAGLAQALSRLLVSFLSASLELTPDLRIFCFAVSLAILTCILFGLAPALRATRLEPGAVMKAGGRGMPAGRERFSLRRALVVAQVALSLLLVAGALLFSRSLNKLVTVDTGFRQEGILIANFRFWRLNLPPERRAAFKNNLLERIRAIPGVEAATDTTIVPLSGNSEGNAVWLDGVESPQKMNSARSWIAPDYFKTLSTRMLAGREFDERDTTGAPKVAIVNETFARKLLNGANPVGRSFWVEKTPSSPETRWEIVGWVKDTKYDELREEFGPIMFLPITQLPKQYASGRLMIRSSMQQSEVSAAVKRVLGEASPTIDVDFQGFKTMIEDSVLRERLLATLSGFFGLLALLLACIGLYGILSYSVASRMNEIGMRMALGAQQRDVLWLVLREAFLLIIAGVAVGLPVIWATTRLASTLLFGLTPTDPVSLILASMLMIAVALAASYLPARQATKVDPLIAVRHE